MPAAPDGPPLALPDQMGHGAAFLDFDQDGWLDILLVGPRPVLFRNQDDGRFRRTGPLDALPQGPYFGVAVGDYDRDGFPDLFLTSYLGGALLRNGAGARYEDVTERAGVTKDRRWSSAATFADLDRDGWLDLLSDTTSSTATGSRSCGSASASSSTVPPPTGPIAPRPTATWAAGAPGA